MPKRISLLNRVRARFISRKPAKEQYAFWVKQFRKTSDAREMIKEHSKLLKNADRGYLEIESFVRTSDYLHAFKRFALENNAPPEILRFIDKSIEAIKG